MKLQYFLFLFIWSLGACNDDYFHDSGLANGRHDCTVWEYLHTDAYNWDSTILVIERAGLVDLFDGKDPEISGGRNLVGRSRSLSGL